MCIGVWFHVMHPRPMARSSNADAPQRLVDHPQSARPLGDAIPKALDLPCPGDMDALPWVVAFARLSTVPMDYNVSDPVVCPPWARAAAEAAGNDMCVVVSCKRKVSRGNARCFGCKKALLCGTHKGEQGLDS